MTSRSRDQDSFSQTVEYSQAVPTLVGVCVALHGRSRRWVRSRRTGETASSSRLSATLRSTTCACARPVQTLRLNSSLGAISSLVYGADCGAGFMQT